MNNPPHSYRDVQLDAGGMSLPGERSGSSNLAAGKHIEMFQFIQMVANNTWRLRRRIVAEDLEARWVRYVEGLENALEQFGVVVKSHEGEPYDIGLAVNVVAWEKRENITRETILETLKPSIRWHDRLLQWGDVVVAVPANVTGMAQKDGEH